MSNNSYNTISITLEESPHSEHYHVRARFCVGQDEMGRPDFGDTLINPGKTMSRFIVSCQGGGIKENPSYAWRASVRDDYDGIVLDDLPHMKRVLSRFEKGRDAYREEFGYPETFGEFIAMICRIFRIKTVLMSPYGWENRNQPSRDVTPGCARRLIDDWIGAMHNKRFGQEVA